MLTWAVALALDILGEEARLAAGDWKPHRA